MSNYIDKDYKNNEYKYYITLSWKYAFKYVEYFQIKNDYEKMKKEVYNKNMNELNNYYKKYAIEMAYNNLNKNEDIIKKKEEVEKIKREYINLDDEYYYLYNKFNT